MAAYNENKQGILHPPLTLTSKPQFKGPSTPAITAINQQHMAAEKRNPVGDGGRRWGLAGC